LKAYNDKLENENEILNEQLKRIHQDEGQHEFPGETEEVKAENDKLKEHMKH
jgi:hypothetical protein